MGIAAKLRPMFFKVLTIALSIAMSMLKAPSGSATAQRSTDWTISAAWVVPSAKLVDGTLIYHVPTWILIIYIYSLRRSFWIVLSAYCCCCLNNYKSSTVVSHTLSPISPRSPSIKVIRSSNGFIAFFYSTTLPFPTSYTTSLGRACTPPDHHHPIVTSLPPLFGVNGNFHFAWSHALPALPGSSWCSTSTQAFSSASFLLFLANSWTFCFAASFFSMDLLVPMARLEGESQFVFQHLMTSLITSFVAM